MKIKSESLNFNADEQSTKIQQQTENVKIGELVFLNSTTVEGIDCGCDEICQCCDDVCGCDTD